MAEPRDTGPRNTGRPETGPRETGADTEMFRAFVERGETERATERRPGLRLVAALLLVLVVVAVAAWLLAT